MTIEAEVKVVIPQDSGAGGSEEGNRDAEARAGVAEEYSGEPITNEEEKLPWKDRKIQKCKVTSVLVEDGIEFAFLLDNPGPEVRVYHTDLLRDPKLVYVDDVLDLVFKRTDNFDPDHPILEMSEIPVAIMSCLHKTVTGTVESITSFGAFVVIWDNSADPEFRDGNPRVSGLLHLSEIPGQDDDAKGVFLRGLKPGAPLDVDVKDYRRDGDKWRIELTLPKTVADRARQLIRAGQGCGLDVKVVGRSMLHKYYEVEIPVLRREGEDPPLACLGMDYPEPVALGRKLRVDLHKVTMDDTIWVCHPNKNVAKVTQTAGQKPRTGKPGGRPGQK